MSILYRAYATPDPKEHVYLREHTTAYIVAWISGARPLYNLRVTYRGHLGVARHDAAKVSPITKE